MARVTINGETIEAKPGENLLALARSNASHIWFVCDGRGLCQTCECRVLSGSENLSAPSDLELNALSESRRRGGYRLACQTKVEERGRVEIISVAEELRRQIAALITPSKAASWGESMGRFINQFSRFAFEFVASLPYSAVKAVPQLLSMPPDIPGMQRYVRDTQRIAERVLTHPQARAKE